MRKTLNISLPEDLHLYIIRRSHIERYSSVSEFIRFLVHRHRIEQLREDGEAPKEPLMANDSMADYEKIRASRYDRFAPPPYNPEPVRFRPLKRKKSAGKRAPKIAR